MTKLYFIILIFILTSCKSDFKILSKKEIVIEKMSIRTLYPENNGVYAGGSNSKFAYFDFDTNKAYLKIIQEKSTDFRALAHATKIYIVNAGSPAKLYEISKPFTMSEENFQKKCIPELIYSEEGEKVFYDSMFMKGDLGYALGDPTENCMTLLKTKDGGKTWSKIPCDSLPKTMEGEAAFAASDTNIKIVNNHIFALTGGIKSRLLKSEDNGTTWQFYDLPIIQGKTMQGGFSMDFYDEKNGIIVGGDYDNQNDNSNNKIATFDGGKTWISIAQNEAFGHASCVQYIPKSKGKKILVAAGDGVYYSNSKGLYWKKVMDGKNFYTIRFNGPKKVYLAGKDRVVQLIIK